MQIEIKLESFEGPMDLLLHLIDKNKVNIYDIPIAEITKQYMGYIDAWQEEDLERVSDFLVMAATLIQIKVRMLLPPEIDEMGEEIDPREDLAQKLMEYRMYKIAANQLKACEKDSMVLHEQQIPDEVQAYEPPIDLAQLLGEITIEQLQKRYQDLIRRSENRVDEVRSKFGTIAKEKLRVSDKIASIMEFANGHRIFSFRGLLREEKSRVDIVVTLLACLELTKMGCLSVSQEVEFGEIYMEWKEEEAKKLNREDLTEYDKGL